MRFITARRNVIKIKFIWVATPILVSVAAFAVYVLQGNELTVSTGFTVNILAILTQQYN